MIRALVIAFLMTSALAWTAPCDHAQAQTGRSAESRGRSLYVINEGARLKASDSDSSRTVTIVPKGSEVRLLDRRGGWYFVRTKRGEQGWMYRGRLAAAPPAQEQGRPGTDIFDVLGGGQVATDQRTTSRGIRGLTPETEAYARRQGTPQQNQRDLDEVLRYGIPNHEIERFLREGGIGEYAK